ncbi:MAG: DMT family transporter [Eggerthellaceae bacterium]|nr:DMT family transporter [Eggerthellaceae bacterium]
MNKRQANICLIAVTFIWSFEVIIHSIIPEGVSPFATACVTSLIGAALLWAYFFRRIGIAIKKQRVLFIRRIVLLGVLNCLYNVLYLIGLEYFDVSIGAFTASMTVVILPVMLLLVKRTMKLRTWISAGCVFAGIVVAVIPNIGHEHLPGIIIMVVGALVRALFIVKLNDYTRVHDPVTLTTGFTAVSALASFIPWVIVEPTTFLALPYSPRLIASYFVFGYFIVAFAMVLNCYAQRRATAAQATIIYSTEIIFTTIWAVFLPDSIIDPVDISPSLIVGCALVVLGNCIEIIRRKPKPEDEAVTRQDDDIMIQTSHPFAVILDKLQLPWARKALVFIALICVYLVIAMPFTVLSVIPGFTDVRPVHMLYPVYGIFFGIPGCFATAMGNLIMDIVTDSLRWSSIAGFIAAFLYPYMMYIFWTRLLKSPFNLRSLRRIAQFAVSIILCAIIMVFIITPAVGFHYGDVDLILFAVSVFGNCTLFPIFFATPFIILIQEELGFEPMSHESLEKESFLKRLS